MRNLKKVLSLTLALVMMLGMMTFAGAAETAKITSKDLTDMNDVVNKEAVSLLVDLGVINGIKQADGTYKYAPKDTINRASYAKMAYAVMMASNNADVYKGVNTGLKDVAGHWAEGFIGYCVTTKLAVGNGSGAYMPDANITTVAAAKMLLVALGYDAKASGYEGDNLWSINIMRDAQKAGLLNNVDQKASENLTRDNAAQLIYNALFANTVVPTYQYDMGVKYLTKYEPNATTLGNETFDLVKVTGTIADTTGADTTISNAKVGATVVNTYNKPWIGLASAKTDKGYSCSFFVDSNGKLLSSAVAPQAAGVYQVPAGLTNSNVVTKAGTVANWLRANGLKYDTTSLDAAFDAGKITVFSEGAAVATATDTRILALSGDKLTLGMTAVAIDTDNNGTIDVLNVFDKQVAQVGANGVSTKTDATTGKTQVKIAAIVASYTDADKVVGYEGLKKDDVVLYYTDGDKTYIEKITPFTAQLTAVSSDSEYTIGGKKYEASTLDGIENTALDIANANADLKIWLDDSGYIIRTERVTEAVAVNVAYVIAYDGAGGGTVLSPHVAKAHLVYADGTAEIVDVKKIKTSTNAASWTALDGTEQLTGTGGQFVTYEKNADGTMNLAAFAETDTKDGKNYDLGVLSAATIENGKAVFAPQDGAKVTVDSSNASMIGNANTVFLIKKTTDGVVSFTVKTGIANAPAYANQATGNALIYDGVATMVCIDSGSAAASTSDATYTYVLGTGYTQYPAVKDAAGNVKTPAYREYKAIADGKVTTIKAEATFSFALAGMYDLTYTDGLVSSASIKIAQQGVEFSGGVVKVGPADAMNYYTENADSLIYVIEDGTVSDDIAASAITTDANDQVYFVAAASGANAATTIGKLYIVRGDNVVVGIGDATKAITGTTGGAVTAATPNTGVTYKWYACKADGSGVKALVETTDHYTGTALATLTAIANGLTTTNSLDASAHHYVFCVVTNSANTDYSVATPICHITVS